MNDPHIATYSIALARPSDLALIPAIELAAARLLAGHAPESVLAEVTSEADLERARREGHLWVALADDRPVGFAHVEVFEPRVAHLDELAVHPDHGRRGLGRRLVEAVCEWAARARFDAVTLRTFRDVPWNMPFYAKLGFEVVPRAALSPALVSVVEDEMRRGLDPERRVVMRRVLANAVGMSSNVRRARADDRDQLLDLWERSVRATHHFLTESHITALRPLVAQELSTDAVEWWVLETTARPIGFLGFANDTIEGLFIDPDQRGRGGGTVLVEHAQRLSAGTLAVDVNEQNGDALEFYKSRGFVVVGRSPTDSGGRPFPILHMKRARHRRVEVVPIQDEAECQALGAFLVDRIYEFNSKATGYFDGRLLAGCVRSDTGEVIAGFDGYTWGGCCELSHVWVHEQYRGQGLGAQLLRSAEAEAVARGCAQIVLMTHSFQAPGFYERMGYERKYAIEDRPKGYADIIYAKTLRKD